MNLPNCLSIIRIALIPLFVVAYLKETGDYHIWSALILLLSGLTDWLDGYIARKYHKITYLGKILDPAADKLTMATVCIVMAFSYPPFIFLAVLYVVKELFMIIGGLLLIKQGKQLAGAKWFGKIATAVLYAVMFIMVFVREIPFPLEIVLLCAASAVVIFAFVMYVPVFFAIQKGREQ